MSSDGNPSDSGNGCCCPGAVDCYLENRTGPEALMVVAWFTAPGNSPRWNDFFDLELACRSSLSPVGFSGMLSPVSVCQS